MMGAMIMALVALVFGGCFIAVAVAMAIVARNARTPDYRRGRRMIDALILAGIGAIWLGAAFLIASMGWETPDAIMHMRAR